jgi:hypothetical protein
MMALLSFSVLRNDATILTLSFTIQMGFPMYVVALFTSYAATYLVLILHRRSVLVIARKDLEDNEKVSISNIFFKRFKVVGPVIIFIVFMLSFMLIIFGINFNGLFLAYSGTLPILAQGQLATRQLTFFGLTNTFVTLNPAEIPVIRALAALYYIIGIAFPVLHIFFLALLWFVPLPITLQGMAFSFTEVLSAWSALEVLLVSLVVLSNNIQIVANLVTGQACVGLQAVIAAMGAQAQALCLGVAPRVDPGAIVSLIGSFLYVIAANVILRIGTYVISYRIRGGIETERRKVAPDDSIGSDPDYGTPPEESYESAQSYSFGTTNKSRSSRLYR